MNKIYGKVLVKETGAGVPNLLIVVFDADPNYCRTENVATLTASSSSGAGGDRLGSVITNEKGYFELLYEDADVQIHAQEKRPDLILFVLAPEDTLNESQPITLPPHQRILHYSYVPRGNAGRTEAYIVRLLAAHLDKVGIPYPKIAATGIPGKDSILSALDDSFAVNDAVQEKLNQRLAKRIKKAKVAVRRAKQAFANFYPSSVPKELRSDSTYLAPGDDFKASQKEIIKRDIDRVRALGKKRSLRLALKPNELDQIGVTTASDGTRTASLKKLFRFIEDKNQGTQFSWARSPLPPCKEDKKSKAIIADITGANHSPGGSVTALEPMAPIGNGEAELTAEALVRDMIARHMEHVTPAEAHLKYGIAERTQQGDITTAINALELRGGPADVTAYHDFHNLQIAFEHVWKEEIDEYLKGWGSLIYEIWISKRDPEMDHENEDEQVETELDLQNLLSEIQRLIYPLQEENQAHGRIVMYALKRPDQGGGPNYPVPGEGNRPSLPRQPEDGRRATPPRPVDPVDSPTDPATTRLQNLLVELSERLAEPYKFDIFVPDSINYGILVTYRQEWTPLNFQVGELVSTIPLAPKETRRYTKKRIVKKSRSQKEIEAALRIVRRDSSDTKRVDAEIVDRAVNKTNFKAAAEGSGKIGGVVELSGSTGLEVDAEKSSTQTKKDFREAVLKAAEEYKQEHRLEVESAETKELEETTSGEITNPNDELTVTYLLYELQRRYEIREKIHRLTPVILVANEVPKAHEIDEDWLIAHDWILKRVILDDSFLPALEFLSKSLVGAEFSIEVLRANVERQASVVEDLRQQITVKREMLGKTFEGLQKALNKQASAVEEDESEGLFESIGEGLFGEGRGESPEAQRIRADRARMAFDQVERELQELQSRLSSEVTALDTATDKYTKALEEHLNRRTEISRLRIHVKQNILYYMQAIWEHEPPDQRYFRLYNKKAGWLPVPEDVEVRVGDGGQIDIEFRELINAFVLESFEEKTLVEIADLDNLLGFKGNYMIFPLKQNNFVTWFMMQPYLNDILLQDPDEFANYTTEELIENFRCRYSQTPDAFTDEEIQQWRDRILQRLTAPRREKDEVIVPTDSLYIEALPGKHPLLEDFKLIHRALDVKKAQAEVRHAEIENVRLAARLLSGEREDPDIEKKIVVEGDSHGVIVSPPDA